jgi:hypothetical protein
VLFRSPATRTTADGGDDDLRNLETRRAETVAGKSSTDLALDAELDDLLGLTGTDN